MEYKIVDLFAGVGGFHLGFEKAGYKTLLATDFDKECFLFNQKNTPWIPFIHGDIKDLDKNTIDKYINGEEVDVLIGGPPCQGFSTIGARISADEKKRRQKDTRNLLFKEYIRVLRILKPKVFLMENVVGMLSLDNGSYFEMIKNEFSKLDKEMGYKFNTFILDAVNYGVPQRRKRVFIFGNRINMELTPPEQTHGEGMLYQPYVTVGEAIGDLAGQENEVLNHIPLNHKEKNILRYKYIPEGGRLPEDELPPELYRKNFGNTFKRLDRNEPSLTMVPGHNAFPIHPWLHRSLTVREAARIQTFDDNLEFIGARHKQCMQVGNAVPPLLAKAWAEHIKKGLDNYYENKK
ncbi:DNA cytosine methyltransferase [Clostridium perfringens]|uniref:DNA cytosine methyltransferase n=1 Tax=Clostridium perfringens TaxID=1502 RepID=UPI001CCCBB0A|nr:DNA cytosine methyltransferase [Clostridium perfringens]MDK0546059.1 DNA cytosine methyltransferase [Clostridium perfringens]UBK62177.1 DNA cytosine methyltransferase [Clostridium perfringens]